MAFLDHLEELRWVLLRCLSAFGVAVAIVGANLRTFADWAQRPYQEALIAVGGDAKMELVNFSPWGVFTVMFQIMFLGGFGLSAPIMFYFLSGFVAPGLTAKERRLLLPGCLAVLVLFLSGAAFSFFVLLPPAMRFMISANAWLGFGLYMDAARYYSMVTWTTVGVGLLFQFPLILILLIYLGALRVAQLRAWRSYAVVACMVVAAFVTPTQDPFTLMFLALPLYVLYEAAMLIGSFVERARAKVSDA